MKKVKKICLGSALVVLALLVWTKQRNQFPSSLVPPSLANVKETDMNADELRIKGDYVKALAVAYEAFKNQAGIPPQKRNVENYEVRLSEDGDHFLVFFYAKRLASEVRLKGGQSELGKDVQYVISKKDYRVLDYKFFK